MEFGDGSSISWTIMQTICTSLPTGNHTSTSSLNFYRLDALPDVQPSVKALQENLTTLSNVTQLSLLTEFSCTISNY